ncbi:MULTISPECIES: universal stress protein [Natronorubrum]|uniref:UspA domain-containing protein n=2 Tax=Natronorubrum bangense TaxID=61858 RepID=L9W5Z9_9EURY|nr:universal stress protein [Natronorubrum bangense]ELY44782.1 UspA domain-containing protein [Natronorubrum bangense JCM 10635]QCC56768.1 universal stress protein [Natronorubrum bangense]
MYTALLPVDDDVDRARRAARAVTSLPGSPEDIHVVVLNVSELKQQPWLVEAETHLTDDSELDESAVPESVAVAHDVLEEYGATIEKRFEHGNPPDRVIAVAAEIMADGIVMCGRKRSAAGKALFGSVTQKVMLESQRPILLIRDE